jgi:hypothetical protein
MSISLGLKTSVIACPVFTFSHENMIDAPKFDIDGKVFVFPVRKHPPATMFHRNRNTT